MEGLARRFRLLQVSGHTFESDEALNFRDTSAQWGTYERPLHGIKGRASDLPIIFTLGGMSNMRAELRKGGVGRCLKGLQGHATCRRPFKVRAVRDPNEPEVTIPISTDPPTSYYSD